MIGRLTSTPPKHETKLPRRCLFLLLIGGLQLLTACGGGGGSGEPPPPRQGTLESRTIASAVIGDTYPLNIYLPPASAGPRWATMDRAQRLDHMGLVVFPAMLAPARFSIITTAASPRDLYPR